MFPPLVTGLALPNDFSTSQVQLLWLAKRERFSVAHQLATQLGKATDPKTLVSFIGPLDRVVRGRRL
jgi:hypothetical protein